MGHNHDDHLHNHNHSHNHGNDVQNINVLIITFVLTFLFMIAEFTGGFFSKSLALISDAGHMLSDAVSMGIAIWAIKAGSKSHDLSKTFGYKRTEVIAAFVNGITLVAVSLLILKEGIQRLFEPVLINENQLILIASLGFLVNLIVAFILFKNSKESINVRGAFLHVISDLLGSVGAIGAGLIIKYTGWAYADPLISIIIAILIMFSSYRLLKETYNTLMEGSPEHIDFQEVIDTVKSINNVQDVHDLHIWSLNESQIILTAHIITEVNSDSRTIISDIKKILHKNFNVNHSTLELETVRCDNGCD